MKPWANYTEAGYDPDDGLTDGRWMYDDERMCQVWVAIKRRPVGRVCEVCETRPVGIRAKQCRACRKRLQAQAERGEVAA